MKKTDFKSRMVVKFRNGYIGLVIEDKIYLKQHMPKEHLNIEEDFNDKLECLYWRDKKFDIVAVYEPLFNDHIYGFNYDSHLDNKLEHTNGENQYYTRLFPKNGKEILVEANGKRVLISYESAKNLGII
jgi:hypothetical protein